MASGSPSRIPTTPIPACRTARTCGTSGVPARRLPWMGRSMKPGRAAGRGQPAGGSRQGADRKAQGAKRKELDARRHVPGAMCVRRLARAGFTLIEILIVITIIGILITLAQPSYNRAVTAAKAATLKENLFILRDAIDQYYADNTKSPASLTDLAEKKYIRRVPKDPVTGSVETWSLVYFTDEQGQQQGILDLKSGSEAIALDGTRYNEW